MHEIKSEAASKWEVGKRYKTRCGGEATVFMTDGRGDYPIIGVVHGHGIDSEASWLADGSHQRTGAPHPFDLMPPEPPVRRGYLNLYSAGGYFHLTREDADRAATGRNRIECREITWVAAEPRMHHGYLNLYPDGRGFLYTTRGGG